MANDTRSTAHHSISELVTGICLIIVSASFGFHSLVMERPGGWGTAPGLMPLILSIALFLLAVTICFSTIKGRIQPAKQTSQVGSIAQTLNDTHQHFGQAIKAACVTGLFYFVLLDLMPFEVAAILFYLAMTYLFWSSASLVRRLMVSIILPLVITIVFQVVLHMPLPGSGSLLEHFIYTIQR
ncbi:MAG: hypothetical protein DHS20C01_32930 [marine bacterium B5-7]|nr:MAG: hypothetical protein DHS20C01_32930 [marine bacterium B5-7]